MRRCNELQHVLGGEHPAIALEARERRLVSRFALGGASIMHTSHVVAAIGAVFDRVVDKLVGEETRHEHILNADIAQHIIEDS